MDKAVDELVKRFHAQLDHIPRISLYDSEKGVTLEIPKKSVQETET